MASTWGTLMAAPYPSDRVIARERAATRRLAEIHPPDPTAPHHCQAPESIGARPLDTTGSTTSSSASASSAEVTGPVLQLFHERAMQLFRTAADGREVGLIGQNLERNARHAEAVAADRMSMLTPWIPPAAQQHD